MRYLSLFSGIEAASQAWHPLGWECAAVSEIEPFPCEVLRQRWPHIPNLGDVTKISEEMIAALGRIDLVVFGSPCQDLSVAGKRKGLAGERSGLFHTAINIIGWAQRRCGLRFALWENVPGAFTSNQGRDFASVVDHLSGLEGTEPPPNGWGTEGCAVGKKAMVEWATLDAQFAGVAQRRRRVFALADFGDWSGRPPILLEPEGMRGDSAPRRGTREDVAGTLASRTEGGGFPGSDEACSGYVQPVGLQRPVLAFGGNNTSGPINVATALNACGTATGRLDFESETFIAFAIQAGALRTNPDSGPDGVGVQADHAYTLEARAEVQAVAFQSSQSGVRIGDVHATLDSNNGPRRHNGALVGMQVRRLTPRECERLQGFPDDYTLIQVRGKPAADGPRYKALGNSMAVPVMSWIGRQIDFAWRFF